MGKNKKINKIILGTIIILLVFWSILIFFIDIENLIEIIGIQNIYLSLFIVAAISGTSFLTSASFYAVFVSYAATGLVDPVMMGIVGGLGMSIGDSMFFVIARKSTHIMRIENKRIYKKIYGFVSKLPHWGVYLFTFFYAAFAPTPNDILMVTLGLLKFRYSRVIPIIIFGNIILLTLIAFGIFNITR